MNGKISICRFHKIILSWFIHPNHSKPVWILSLMSYVKRSLAECPSSVTFMYLFIKTLSEKVHAAFVYTMTMNGDQKGKNKQNKSTKNVVCQYD